MTHNLEKCPALITTKNSVTHHSQHTFHGHPEIEKADFLKVMQKGAVNIDCKQEEHKFIIPSIMKKDTNFINFVKNNSKSRTISVRINENNLQHFKMLIVNILYNLKCQKDIGGLAHCFHKECKCFQKILASDWPLGQGISEALSSDTALSILQENMNANKQSFRNEEKFWVIVVNPFLQKAKTKSTPPGPLLDKLDQANAAKRLLEKLEMYIDASRIKRQIIMIVLNDAHNESVRRIRSLPHVEFPLRN